jgi:hypothetical protein
MTITIWIAGLMVIQSGGGAATTRPATTQAPSASQKADVQTAARDLREAIRNNVQQEINAARIQAQAQGAAIAGQAEPAIAPPAPPEPPRTFTIRGRDGTETITIPPRAFDNTIPPQAVTISVAFFLMMAAIVIGLPLARAFARRMDRRGGTAQVSNEVSSQLAHLNQAVDAIALEVERISEGQRFTTRLLSEQKDAARQPLSSGASR